MSDVPKIPKSQLCSSELHRISMERSVFLQSETLVLVPWRALAAIWYRESFALNGIATPGGPFQFDPRPTADQLKEMLHRYAKNLTATQIDGFVSEGIDQFSSACLFAACHLRDVARYDLAVDQSDEAIKDAFYGYNGRGYGPSPDDSPYVMNNFDSAHLNMRIIGKEPDGHGGRIRVDTIDLRPGAFTVYKQLSLIDLEPREP